MERCDYVIVGAGLSGVVAARILAEAGYKVLIIEKRHHVSGLCHDLYDEHGIFVHKYGPHLFHTNDEDVWNFINLFCGWIPHEHIAKVRISNNLCDFPINKNTIKQLNIKDVPVNETPDTTNAKTYLHSTIGATLTKLIFEDYTKKHWGTPLEDLDFSVVQRVGIQHDNDSRYFRDKYQAIPQYGYTHFVNKMILHDNIYLVLGLNYYSGFVVPKKGIIYTGPIDKYFNYCFGPLDYIHVRFFHKTYDKPFKQIVTQINYPEASIPFTRSVEYKHITKQIHPQTTISYEFPQKQNESSGIPCYPKLNTKSTELFQKYYELAQNETHTLFLGRMAEYKYFNMDAAIGNAINKTKTLLQ